MAICQRLNAWPLIKFQIDMGILLARWRQAFDDPPGIAHFLRGHKSPAAIPTRVAIVAGSGHGLGA